MKTMSTFKKSVLSIVILSAVTGSFISWDKYQPRNETPSMAQFYQGQDHDFDENEVLLDSMVSNDSKTLASLAEANLLIEPELITPNVAENSYSPEADEPYDYALEDEKLAMREEDQWLEEKINDELNDALTTGKVLFAFDSSKIEADYFPLLNKTAQLMQEENIDESQIWQVVGYADLSGNYIYNGKLAQKRAQAVTEYLVNKGVNEDQLVMLSLGASQPASTERNIENNRLERRVEINEFQSEIAMLSEQFNDGLEQEVAKRKKKQIPAIKTKQIETKVVESSDPLKAEREVAFKQKNTQSITTVMEL